ncbi:hypothetical protein U9M48_038828 [Paspalum notatum var. saurae]|uniref:malate dehydrogenase n=1 Tax=Paspalum notatum var. saurae TaxID=547442 RepID=A0AAQ3XBG7_PASNO
MWDPTVILSVASSLNASSPIVTRTTTGGSRFGPAPPPTPAASAPAPCRVGCHLRSPLPPEPTASTPHYLLLLPLKIWEEGEQEKVAVAARSADRAHGGGAVIFELCHLARLRDRFASELRRDRFASTSRRNLSPHSGPRCGSPQHSISAAPRRFLLLRLGLRLRTPLPPPPPRRRSASCAPLKSGHGGGAAGTRRMGGAGRRPCQRRAWRARAASLGMAATGTFTSVSAQAGQIQKPRSHGAALKAPSSVSFGSESSFLGRNASLRAAVAPRIVPKAKSGSQISPQASYKVAVLGAAGGIGQPLGLLIKMSPLVSELRLYDIANVKGVAADLSHCNTPAQVLDFTGASELANCLKGVDVVVIPAGVPRKPGMTRDDLFNINAGIVKSLVEAVADNCPEAFIHIISNPVNSTVPIAAEVLKKKGVYNPKKLFGVTTLDVVRANTFVAQKKNLKLIDVDVPVVGGHAGITILPLLSKTRPSVTFTDEETEELTKRIQNAGTEVVEAKAGAGSATLSMAYAAARFVESSLRALAGDPDVYECTFIQSEITDLPFFASRVKLGKNGVESVISADIEGVTEYEAKALEALKAELKGSIEKGVAFANKQQETAAPV